MKEKIISLNKKDFEIQTFRSGGPGGQKQNKTSTGVRIIHRESNSVGESRTHRSQSINKKEAFKHLISSNSFQSWLKLEINRKCGILDKVNEKVDEMMNLDNIKIEIVDENGNWVEE